MPEDPPSWLVVLLFLGAGFVLLAKGADWLVGGSTRIAHRLGVSTLVIGLTVIAFGTSAPEIVVSSVAAARGKTDISLGNVLGSNVANIGLVLGACAVVLPTVLESKLSRREIFWLFMSLAILWWITSDRAIVRMEAWFLLAVFAVYNAHVIITSRAGVKREQYEEDGGNPFVALGLGLFGIAAGAYLVVEGAEAGALRLGVPQSVIALTVVAIGTSLPELAAGLGGALRGESEISIGNVVGSNVFNLLAVIGIVGIIQPLDPQDPGIENITALETTFDLALNEDFFVVLLFSLAAVLMPFFGGKRGRAKGVVLLVAYVAYCGWLFSSRELVV